LTRCNAEQLVKKLLETMDLEAVLRRLDRLTHDEARMAAAQILEIVYRIVQNMGVLMDGELSFTKFVAFWVLSFHYRRQGIGRPSKECPW